MRDPETDPREEPFVVELDALSDEARQGLVEAYCTQYHGLNEREEPLSDAIEEVNRALEDGRLVVWFDPVEQQAALAPPVS